MLVIEPEYRGQGIALSLVHLTIKTMEEKDHVDEITLETEVINLGALRLYESLGFLRTKRLYRYYLNTHDAYRLILPLSENSGKRIAFLPPLDEAVVWFQFAEYNEVELASLSAKSPEVGCFAQLVELELLISNYM